MKNESPLFLCFCAARFTAVAALQAYANIDECAAGLTPQFTIFPFYKILDPSEVMRKNEERFFISNYKPFLNDLKLR